MSAINAATREIYLDLLTTTYKYRSHNLHENTAEVLGGTNIRRVTKLCIALLWDIIAFDGWF